MASQLSRLEPQIVPSSSALSSTAKHQFTTSRRSQQEPPSLFQIQQQASESLAHTQSVGQPDPVYSNRPVSTVTSSELIATITGKGITSPAAGRGALDKDAGDEPDDLLFTPSQKEHNTERVSVQTNENLAPNKLQTVQE